MQNHEAAQSDEKDLSILALNAAMQLDRLLIGDRQPEAEPIVHFLESLQNTSGLEFEGDAPRLHADPVTVEILSTASHTVSTEPMQTVDDLGELVSAVMQGIAKIISANVEEQRSMTKFEIQQFKKFCLSLHDAFLAETAETLEENETVQNDALAIR
jgi:hypothetical protein